MNVKRFTGEGVIILAGVLCLLVLYSYPYAQEAPAGCGCNSCHGNPPIVNTIGGPNGLAGAGFTAGAHETHTGGTFGPNQNNICYRCHFDGMPFSPICGQNLLQMGFNINGTSGAGSVYNGSTTLNPPWVYAGTNGTAINMNGSMTCSNIYCHGPGTGGTANVASSSISTFPPLTDPRPVAAGTSPAWTASGPLACTACHGFPPSYVQDQPKSNSHLYGLFAGDAHRQPCNVCHHATTMDGQTITNATNHGNALYNLQPDPNATYNGQPVTFDYHYDAGGGTCSNVACHGGNFESPPWGRQFVSTTIVSNSGTECYAGVLTAQFSGGTSPFTCLWNLGDGNTMSGCTVDHVYTSPGPFTVTVQGRDANYHPFFQAASITTQTVNTPPTASNSVSVACFVVTLTDLSTDPDYNSCGHSGNGTIGINWGDGQVTQPTSVALSASPSNRVFTHTYASTSSYNIIETVTDNSGALVNVSRLVSVPSVNAIGGRVTHGTPPTGLSGVTMVLRRNGVTVVQTATTDANGNYNFAPNPPSTGGWGCGTYTVTATRAGFTFDGDPATSGNQNPVTVTVQGSDLTVNFTATP